MRAIRGHCQNVNNLFKINDVSMLLTFDYLFFFWLMKCEKNWSIRTENGLYDHIGLHSECNKTLMVVQYAN